MKLKSLLGVAFVTSITFIQAQDLKTADEVLTKYFQATGGIDKWKALKTRKMEGKMNMQGNDLAITVLEKRPLKQKGTYVIQGMEIIQAYDGVDAWAINPMAGSKDPVRMSDEETKIVKDKDVEDPFIDYKKKGHEVTLQGTEVIDQVKCYKIQIVKNKNNPKDDVTETYYFDAENFVPILQVSVPDAGPLKGTVVKNYMSDYQEVNGLMIPFSIEMKFNDQTFQKTTYTKITIDEPIDDSVFAFPKKN